MKFFLAFLLSSGFLFAQNISWFQIRNTPVVSVGAFGALCDGTTDDIAAINFAVAYAETLRNSYEDGTVELRFPKGVCVVSAPITIDMNRITISGAGSRGTILKLKTGTNLPTPTIGATTGSTQGNDDATDFGLSALSAGEELVRRAVLESTRTRHMFWSIRDIGIDGNGTATSKNNTCVALYEMQQGGMENVTIYNCGGVGLYLGLGNGDTSNPETALNIFTNVFVNNTKEENIFHTHAEAYNTYNKVVSEGSVDSDCIVARGLFVGNHVEHCRYGFNLYDFGGTIQSTIIGAQGYAVGSAGLGYQAGVSMIFTDDTNGVSSVNSFSQGFGNFACVDTGSGCASGVVYAESGGVGYWNNLSFMGYNQMRRLQLGAPQTIGGGFPTDPLIVRAIATGETTGRYIDSGAATDAKWQSSADYVGAGRAFILFPDGVANGTNFFISYGGNPTYQFRSDGYKMQVPITGVNNTNCGVYAGAASPEGAVTADACSIYFQPGGSSAAIWYKITGSGNTGWQQRSAIAENNYTPTAVGSLGTPADGTVKFCSDCTVTSGADNTCAGSGSGALAIRISSVWRCFNAQN